MTLGFHSYGSYKCSLKAFTIAVQDKRQQVNTTWEARNNTRAVLIIKSLRGSLSQFSTNGGILLTGSKISLGCSQVCNSDGQWSLLFLVLILKFQSCGLIQSLLLLRRVREIHFALNCKFEVFITFKVRQIRLAFTCTSEEELLGEYWFFPSKETWLVSSLIFKKKWDFSHVHCALMPLFAALCTGHAMQLCSPIAPLARVSFLQNLGLQTGDSETETWEESSLSKCNPSEQRSHGGTEIQVSYLRPKHVPLFLVPFPVKIDITLRAGT